MPNVSSNDTFAIVYKYHTLGRCVIPSDPPPDGKAALIQWKDYQTTKPTDAQLQDWQDNLHLTIWAMIIGSVSGCFVIDCDTQQAVGMMEVAGLKPHVKTRKGCHYYCHWPAWTVRNSSRLLPGVDMRGEGGYVNFAGGNGKANYEVLLMPVDDNLYTLSNYQKKSKRYYTKSPPLQGSLI